VPGLGTAVNAGAVLAGTLAGMLFGRLIPERVRSVAMTALGLAVLYVGLQMALDPHIDPAKFHYAGPLPYRPNPLVVIGGMVIGAILGELMGLERRLESFGERMKALVSRTGAPGGGGHHLVEGFVTATLIYCVGAMAVIGAIQDAAGQPATLYVKAMLDGIGSIMLASAFGIGVGLSVLPLVLYQGGITLAASTVTPYLVLPVMATLTCTGGLLIAAIGFGMTGIKKLPVANLLPGVFVASALAYFFG
jgi:uncharacterized membrane protein YqgA involved in biofilm formation